MFSEKTLPADTVRLLERYNLNCDEFYSRLNQLLELQKQVDEAIEKIEDIDVFDKLKTMSMDWHCFDVLQILRDMYQIREYAHVIKNRRENFYRVRDYMSRSLPSRDEFFEHMDKTIDFFKMKLKIANSKFDELPEITK